jgi:hypothetical protein
MSSFVNFLKNLLSGVFSFFGGLFSSKKAQDAIAGTAPKPRKARNSGYFLELDEAKGVGNGAAAPTKATTAAVVKESATLEHAKADATAPVLQPEPAQSKRTAKPAAEKVEPKPAAANAALNLPQPTVITFAPKYLAPSGSSNGRRRPGANMSSFLDMARQVKTSS